MCQTATANLRFATAVGQGLSLGAMPGSKQNLLLIRKTFHKIHMCFQDGTGTSCCTLFLEEKSLQHTLIWERKNESQKAQILGGQGSVCLPTLTCSIFLKAGPELLFVSGAEESWHWGKNTRLWQGLGEKNVTLLPRKCSYPWTRVGQEKKLQAWQLPEKAQN